MPEPGLVVDELLEPWPLELVALEPFELEFVLVVELLPPGVYAGEDPEVDGVVVLLPDVVLELELEVELDGLEPCESFEGVVADGEEKSLLAPFSEPLEPPTAFKSGQLFAASPGALLIWFLSMLRTRCFCPGAAFKDVIGTAICLSPTPRNPPTETTAYEILPLSRSNTRSLIVPSFSFWRFCTGIFMKVLALFTSVTFCFKSLSKTSPGWKVDCRFLSCCVCREASPLVAW